MRFIQEVNQGKRSFLTIVFTIILVILAFVIGQVPLEIISRKIGITLETLISNNSTLSENSIFLLLLLPFIFALIMLFICVGWIHERPIKSIITPFQKISSSRILVAFGVWFLLMCGYDLVAMFFVPESYQFQLDWKRFLQLLLIAVLLLPLQSSFEELFFRGYILQFVSWGFKSAWIGIVGTSIIFALMHLDNPEIEQFGKWNMLLYYFLFGIILAWITVADDRLEIALGMHAANNFYGATMVSFEGSAIQTPSLFYLTDLNFTVIFWYYIVAATIFFLIMQRLFHFSLIPKPLKTA